MTLILHVKFRDKTPDTGGACRRVENLTLEAECASDLDLLGRLATRLVADGATTAAALRGIVEPVKAEVELPVP